MSNELIRSFRLSICCRLFDLPLRFWFAVAFAHACHLTSQLMRLICLWIFLQIETWIIKYHFVNTSTSSTCYELQYKALKKMNERYCIHPAICEAVQWVYLCISVYIADTSPVPLTCTLQLFWANSADGCMA